MTIKEWFSDPKICTKERLAYFLKHAKKSVRFRRWKKERILLSFLEGQSIINLKEFEKGDYEVLGEEMAEVIVSHNPYRLNQVPLTPRVIKAAMENIGDADPAEIYGRISPAFWTDELRKQILVIHLNRYKARLKIFAADDERIQQMIDELIKKIEEIK